MAGDTHPFTLTLLVQKHFLLLRKTSDEPPEQHANSLKPFISIMLTAGTHMLTAVFTGGSVQQENISKSSVFIFSCHHVQMCFHSTSGKQWRLHFTASHPTGALWAQNSVLWFKMNQAYCRGKGNETCNVARGVLLHQACCAIYSHGFHWHYVLIATL